MVMWKTLAFGLPPSIALALAIWHWKVLVSRLDFQFTGGGMIFPPPQIDPPSPKVNILYDPLHLTVVRYNYHVDTLSDPPRRQPSKQTLNRLVHPLQSFIHLHVETRFIPRPPHPSLIPRPPHPSLIPRPPHPSLIPRPPHPSLVPRSFPRPVFDRLQYAKTEGEGLGSLVM